MLPELPYVLYMQLQHQGNSLEMVLLSIFFTRIRSTEDVNRCSLFILLHACLHLAVKILLQIFLYEDLSVVTYICQLYFLQNASRIHFVTQPILLVKTFL